MNANNLKTKAVIFDFDGTLTKPNKYESSWERTWAKIDKLDEDERLYNLFETNKLTFNQWLEEIFKVYKDSNVSISTFTEIANETELIPNAEKTLKNLYENNIKIFILSGGIGNIIQIKLKKILKYIEDIEAYFFEYDKNGIINNVTMPKLDVEDKSNYVNYIKDKYNLKKDEIVFIGNDKNDEDAYKTGIKTICINPNKANYTDKEIWNHCILSSNNLEDIEEYINFE